MHDPATQDRSLVFLKFGGSLITDKQRPRAPRPEVLERLCRGDRASAAETPRDEAGAGQRSRLLWARDRQEIRHPPGGTHTAGMARVCGDLARSSRAQHDGNRRFARRRSASDCPAPVSSRDRRRWQGAIMGPGTHPRCPGGRFITGDPRRCDLRYPARRHDPLDRRPVRSPGNPPTPGQDTAGGPGTGGLGRLPCLHAVDPRDHSRQYPELPAGAGRLQCHRRDRRHGEQGAAEPGARPGDPGFEDPDLLR